MLKIYKVLLIALLINAAGMRSQTQICTNCDYTGWSYYQKIAINNASNTASLSNFQVSLTIDTQTLVSQGKMLSSGNDIRFTSLCSGGTNYNYWIESGMNTPTTTIWIKIPAIAASSIDTLYLHYGNGTATAASSGSLTFAAFDDFETNNLSAWTFSGGTWTITNLSGNNVLSSTSLVYGNGLAAVLNSSLSLNEYYVDVDNMFSLPDAYGGPLFEHNDFNNYFAYHYMPDVQATMNSLIQGGAANYTMSNAAAGAANTWYPWSVKRTTGQIDVYFNSVLTRTVTSVFSDGVGVWSYGNALGTVYFDNIRVRKVTTVQPGLSAGLEIYTTAPTLTVSGTQAICIGATAILTGSGTDTYSWSTAQTSASVSLTPTVSTTYSLTGTNTLIGCSNTVAHTVTVNPLPIVSISGGTAPVCSGQSVGLTANGGNSYLWVVLNATTQAISVTPTVTTNYMVHATDLNGCMDMSMKTITVNPLPTLSINGASAVCQGSGTTLTVTGASTYTWNTTANTNTITASPGTNAVYTVQGTNANGCKNIKTHNMTVHALPNVSIGGPASSCAGSLLTFTASGASTYTWNTTINTTTLSDSPTSNTSYSVGGKDNNGCVSTASLSVLVHPLPNIVIAASSSIICNGEAVNIAASGANTFTWNANNSLTTTALVETPSVNTVYTISGTDANSCVNTKNYTILVNPVPTLALSGPAAICSGEAAVFNASGANSYSWNASPAAPSVTTYPTSNTTYTLVGSYTTNCSSTATIGVTVNPLPTISISAPTEICNGSSVQLTANGADTYTWNATISGTTILETPTITTTYTLIGTDSNGCTDSSTHSIAVKDLPVISINGQSVSCSGNSITLNASGAATYTWNGIAGTGAFSETPIVTTSYTATGTGTNGCTGKSVFTVTVKPLPAITVSTSTELICAGETSTLSAAGGASYIWNTTQTNNSITVSPAVSTTYTVNGIGNNGCENTAVITQSVSECTDITAQDIQIRLQVYPNPNSGSFSVSGGKDLQIVIRNQLGQLIRNFELDATNQYTMHISDLAQGIYYVSAQNNTQRLTQKIIVGN